MTAAEAAAQIAKLTAAGPTAYGASSGVFSLDQLVAIGKANAGTPDPGAGVSSGVGWTRAPGTTGAVAPSVFTDAQMRQDWIEQGKPEAGALIAGGGNAALIATGLKAGYYQIPGRAGAEYYDPRLGRASSEFVKWANALTPDQRDPFTGQPTGFIPLEGGPQAVNAANQASDGALKNFEAIIAMGKGSDGTYQDSQDRVLGIGKYQQFLLDKNGKQIRVSDIPGLTAAAKASAGSYQDVSTFKEPVPKAGIRTGPTTSDFWKTAEAGVAANEKHNQDAYFGLQQERIIAAAQAAGKDPGTALADALAGRGDTAATDAIANTGISQAQTKQIYDTYNRIQDPLQKAAYIAYQDPGNLTSGLRQARFAARAGERSWMLKNALAPKVTYEMSSRYGDKSNTGGQVKTTYGDVTQTDATTGRSVMFGNVVTGREYVAPGDRGSFDAAAHRIGGALYGGVMGFISSFGSPSGAVLGAASGSGLLSGINLKKPGQTKWGQYQTPGDIKDVAVNFGEAIVFAHFGGQGMGRLGHAAFGSGFGSVNGFLSGGVRGGVGGTIFGGIGGAMNPGRNAQATWAQKMMGPSWAGGA